MKYKQIKKKCVLFILPSLQIGGAEKALIMLMNSLDRCIYEPKLICLTHDGDARSWVSDEIDIFCLGKKYICRSFFALLSIVKTFQPDLMFSTMTHANALAISVKIFFPKTKIVVREATLPSVLIAHYGFKGKLSAIIYKVLYPRANVVLSNCNVMLDDFRDKIGVNVNNHRLINNFVSPDVILKGISEKFTNFRHREKTIYFVAIGRLSFEKGFLELIKQLKEFKPKTKWRLDIFGEGPLHDQLSSLINEMNLERNILLKGSHNNPWKTAATADALVLPSLWEGMPNVALESLFMGVPVIAKSSAGGIKDLAQEVKPPSLFLVDEIEEFIPIMEDIKPKLKSNKAASILPEKYYLKSVIKEFNKIMADV